MGTFLQACWTGESRGIGPVGVSHRHVANGVKGVREYSLHYILGCHCGGIGCISQAGVRAAGGRGLEGGLELSDPGKGRVVGLCVF